MGAILIIGGTIIIILGNVTCVFQTIVTPDYSYRKIPFCCSLLSCNAKDITYTGSLIFYSDDQGCYVCNTSLYGDKVTTAIGSIITFIGIILIILGKKLKFKQSTIPKLNFSLP